jgi:ribonuclease MRP protein subunit RMP1
LNRAFSTVVKDIQYASLGLMLLATLAEIKSVIRPLGKELVVEKEEDEDEVFAGAKQVIESSREDEHIQDLGEVVSREELKIMPLEDHEDVEEEIVVRKKSLKVKPEKSETVPELESGSETRPKKRSKEEKKKRKRGDAFDDLFDSLI